MTTPTRALRGRLLTFTDDPATAGADSYSYIEDGLVLLGGGRILDVGEASALLPRLAAQVWVDHYPGKLILPGFIDAHIHFPQTQVIASYGAQLMDWLERYALVEEQRFADAGHAAAVASFFLDELARNGTTTAAVYGTVHPQAAEAFFAESHRRNTRMIAGKVLMDRNAPAGLTDTAESGYDESKALIRRWHGKGRQLYAVTPRFAITSTEAQLEAAGALLKEHPDCYLQTHLSENRREIETVHRLFPWAESYTAVYDRFGLLGPRSLFGHCIHLDDGERERLSDSGSVAVFCPTSNLFIGSGLFDRARARCAAHPLRVALATDVGGGTSYSMLATLAEAYKVLQLQDQNLPALEAFHAVTLGNARALGLDDRIGALVPGREADIVVLDARATPAMAHRAERIATLEEELFLLMTLGDDRAVAATYVAGERVHALVSAPAA
jgi:guanine deaminase